MECFFSGCRNEAPNKVGIRMRRPKGKAYWAPNLEIYFCEDHSSQGMKVNVEVVPTSNGQAEFVVSELGGRVLIRKYDIPHKDSWTGAIRLQSPVRRRHTCIVPKCGKEAGNNLAIRIRKPDENNILAPNTRAYLCDHHALSGLVARILMEPTKTGFFETNSSSLGGPVWAKRTRIKRIRRSVQLTFD